MTPEDFVDEYHRGYNEAIEDVRDKLAGKMRKDEGYPRPYHTRHVVDWNEVEYTLDKLKVDE